MPLEFQTAVNPKTNLSRCFRYEKNFNTIDLVMTCRSSGFVDSVKYLKKILNSKVIRNGSRILFEKGDHLTVRASDKPIRFLLLTGRPLKEPVAWKGPIAMNTQEQLDSAFQEYKDGTFIKSK